MNYPFLFYKIDTLNADDLLNSIQFSDNLFNIYKNWNLRKIQSSIVSEFIINNYPHLKLFKDSIYLSEGTSSEFHTDQFYTHHLLHRVLIPLDINFKYEWVLNNKVITYQPSAGEVLLFNNMVQHRFVSTDDKPRRVVYFELIDPLIESPSIKAPSNDVNKVKSSDKIYQFLIKAIGRLGK